MNRFLRGARPVPAIADSSGMSGMMPPMPSSSATYGREPETFQQRLANINILTNPDPTPAEYYCNTYKADQNLDVVALTKAEAGIPVINVAKDVGKDQEHICFICDRPAFVDNNGRNWHLCQENHLPSLFFCGPLSPLINFSNSVNTYYARLFQEYQRDYASKKSSEKRVKTIVAQNIREEKASIKSINRQIKAKNAQIQSVDKALATYGQKGSKIDKDATKIWQAIMYSREAYVRGKHFRRLLIMLKSGAQGLEVNNGEPDSDMPQPGVGTPSGLTGQLAIMDRTNFPRLEDAKPELAAPVRPIRLTTTGGSTTTSGLPAAAGPAGVLPGGLTFAISMYIAISMFFGYLKQISPQSLTPQEQQLLRRENASNRGNNNNNGPLLLMDGTAFGRRMKPSDSEILKSYVAYRRNGVNDPDALWVQFQNADMGNFQTNNRNLVVIGGARNVIYDVVAFEFQNNGFTGQGGKQYAEIIIMSIGFNIQLQKENVSIKRVLQVDFNNIPITRIAGTLSPSRYLKIFEQAQFKKSEVIPSTATPAIMDMKRKLMTFQGQVGMNQNVNKFVRNMKTAQQQRANAATAITTTTPTSTPTTTPTRSRLQGIRSRINKPKPNPTTTPAKRLSQRPSQQQLVVYNQSQAQQNTQGAQRIPDNILRPNQFARPQEGPIIIPGLGGKKASIHEIVDEPVAAGAKKNKAKKGVKKTKNNNNILMIEDGTAFGARYQLPWRRGRNKNLRIKGTTQVLTAVPKLTLDTAVTNPQIRNSIASAIGTFSNYAGIANIDQLKVEVAKMLAEHANYRQTLRSYRKSLKLMDQLRVPDKLTRRQLFRTRVTKKLDNLSNALANGKKIKKVTVSGVVTEVPETDEEYKKRILKYVNALNTALYNESIFSFEHAFAVLSGGRKRTPHFLEFLTKVYEFARNSQSMDDLVPNQQMLSQGVEVLQLQDQPQQALLMDENGQEHEAPPQPTTRITNDPSQLGALVSLPPANDTADQLVVIRSLFGNQYTAICNAIFSMGITFPEYTPLFLFIRVNPHFIDAVYKLYRLYVNARRVAMINKFRENLTKEQENAENLKQTFREELADLEASITTTHETYARLRDTNIDLQRLGDKTKPNSEIGRIYKSLRTMKYVLGQKAAKEASGRFKVFHGMYVKVRNPILKNVFRKEPTRYGEGFLMSALNYAKAVTNFDVKSKDQYFQGYTRTNDYLKANPANCIISTTCNSSDNMPCLPDREVLHQKTLEILDVNTSDEFTQNTAGTSNLSTQNYNIQNTFDPASFQTLSAEVVQSKFDHVKGECDESWDRHPDIPIVDPNPNVRQFALLGSEGYYIVTHIVHKDLPTFTLQKSKTDQEVIIGQQIFYANKRIAHSSHEGQVYVTFPTVWYQAAANYLKQGAEPVYTILHVSFVPLQDYLPMPIFIQKKYGDPLACSFETALGSNRARNCLSEIEPEDSNEMAGLFSPLKGTFKESTIEFYKRFFYPDNLRLHLETVFLMHPVNECLYNIFKYLVNLFEVGIQIKENISHGYLIGANAYVRALDSVSNFPICRDQASLSNVHEIIENFEELNIPATVPIDEWTMSLMHFRRPTTYKPFVVQQNHLQQLFRHQLNSTTSIGFYFFHDIFCNHILSNLLHFRNTDPLLVQVFKIYREFLQDKFDQFIKDPSNFLTFTDGFQKTVNNTY